MSRIRRNHDAAFKAKVALEAVTEELTVAELSAKYQVHQTLIHEWKRALVERAATVFEKKPGKAEQENQALVGDLYKQIGQLTVERDFLSRKLGR